MLVFYLITLVIHFHYVQTCCESRINIGLIPFELATPEPINGILFHSFLS
mgnify:CR=1 FL=1